MRYLFEIVIYFMLRRIKDKKQAIERIGRKLNEAKISRFNFPRRLLFNVTSTDSQCSGTFAVK